MTGATATLLALALIVGLARVLGDLCRRVGLPPLLGEIAAGTLLGPAVLGSLWPSAHDALFVDAGPVRGAIASLGGLLFLLLAGLEVDPTVLARIGRRVAPVAAFGLGVPMAFGAIAGFLLSDWLGFSGAVPAVGPLFLAVALGVSALPVIVRILLDLELLRTDFGLLVVASVVAQDVPAFGMFAVVLVLAGAGGAGVAGLLGAVLGPVLLGLALLGPGRRLLAFGLDFAPNQGSRVALAVVVALAAGAAAEHLGTHAVFGAFFAGVATASARPSAREQVRAGLEPFVHGALAPLFFAGLGLEIDLVAAFDPLLVAFVLVVGFAGKWLGGAVGGRMAGLPWPQALALGAALNARGAMEIILGRAARDAGVIEERLLVALLALALVSSAVAGPAVVRLLPRAGSRVLDVLAAPAFVPALAARDAAGAIRELSHVLAGVTGLSAEAVQEAVARRESVMHTGMPGGLAVPHAELPGLTRPLVAVGISASGIDFDAPDGSPARLVCLVLTPPGDIDLIAELGHTFHRPELLARVVRARDFSELAALIRASE